MSKRLSVFLVCAVLLAGCSPAIAPTAISTPAASAVPMPTLAPTLTPTPTAASTPTPAATATPAYPDLAISIRYPCALGCGPQITIDALGNVTYQKGHTPSRPALVGSAKITPAQIEELVAAINKSNVWDIENQDDNRCCDLVPLVVSVTLNGRTKTVARYDAADARENCSVTAFGTISEPGKALCKLRQTVARITNWDRWDGPWMTPTPPLTVTPVISTARVVFTVYIDQNANGTPEPGEGLDGIPVELHLPDGKVLSRTTQQGVATFDMSGYAAASQITASIPSLYRSYQFYLPQSGTLPIIFSFAQPTLPTKSP